MFSNWAPLTATLGSGLKGARAALDTIRRLRFPTHLQARPLSGLPVHATSCFLSRVSDASGHLITHAAVQISASCWVS